MAVTDADRALVEEVRQARARTSAVDPPTGDDLRADDADDADDADGAREGGGEARS